MQDKPTIDLPMSQEKNQICLDTRRNLIDAIGGRDHPPPQKPGPSVSECLDANEVGDGRLFNKLHHGRYVFDHGGGRWYAWRGHCWVEDVCRDVIDAGLDAVVDQYLLAALIHAEAAGDASRNGEAKEVRRFQAVEKNLLKRVAALQTKKRRTNVLELAAAGTGLRGDEWDQKPSVLAVTNGVIDLITGELKPGKPGDYLKTCAPTEYQGVAVPCPTWQRFLSEVFGGDESVIDYLQRLFGYALMGRVIEHVLPIFYGTGRNGKSTFLETLKHVLGDYAYKAEAELLLTQKQPKQSGAANSGVMALRGKRIVWAPETDEGRYLALSRVKDLAGGETLNARPLYGKHHVEFQPSHLLLLLTNNKPKVPANDFALWQRIHLVPFQMAFVHSPKAPNERKADTHLSDKLKAESSGILAWMVRGCLDYQRQGLNPPEVVTAATEAYRQDEDTVGQFIEECCELGPFFEVKAGLLHGGYKDWCVENSYRPFGPKRFGEDIRARGFDSYVGTTREVRGVHFVGIRLVPTC